MLKIDVLRMLNKTESIKEHYEQTFIDRCGDNFPNDELDIHNRMESIRERLQLEILHECEPELIEETKQVMFDLINVIQKHGRGN